MPGMVCARLSFSGVADVLGNAVAGDPAGDALADLEAQLLHVLALVLADLAPPRDRHAVLAIDAVDADVVEVDEAG